MHGCMDDHRLYRKEPPPAQLIVAAKQCRLKSDVATVSVRSILWTGMHHSSRRPRWPRVPAAMSTCTSSFTAATPFTTFTPFAQIPQPWGPPPTAKKRDAARTGNSAHTHRNTKAHAHSHTRTHCNPQALNSPTCI